MIHTFLMIGQSNMAGRGKIGEVTPFQNSRLFMLRNGRWQPMHEPVNPDRPFSGVSPAESFADAYQREHGVDVGLIPCADGGTQIEQWKEGGLLFDNAAYQTELAERTGSLAGILWHQGESDCVTGRFEQYEARFEAFYAALTHKLRAEEIPFLMGGMGDFLLEREAEGPYCQKMNALLAHIASRHEKMRFVSASGLDGYPDHLHFTAYAAREFGIRYYKAFRTAEDRSRIFPEKPREDDFLRTELDAL